MCCGCGPGKRQKKKKEKRKVVSLRQKQEFPSWHSGSQIWLGTMRLWVRSLPLLSGLRIRRCRELWCRLQTRLGSSVAMALLWLWRRPVATAPIQPLAWEPPYAAGAAQEIATTTTTKKTKRPKKKLLGVPVVAQQKQIWLVSMRTQVQSLALLSGLRIPHWHKLWHRS